MKKLFSIMLSLVMIASMFVFTSCDDDEDLCAHTYNHEGVCTKCGEHDAEFVEGQEITFTDAVTIKFYHTMGANLKTVLDEYLVEFKELFPNITIEHQQIGGYDDVKNQISTEITAGNQPNMAYCYPDHVATYNASGAVKTLDSFINTNDYIMVDGEKYYIGLSGAEIDNFIEGYYAEGTSFGNSKMYTMPFSKSTEVLYYNATFFEENNISVPDHWFSIDQNDTTSLEFVINQIKQIDSTSIPLGYDSEANWFITMCEQLNTPYTAAKGEHYLFNTTENRNFVEKFREWYQQGLMTTQELYGSYTSGLFTATGAEDQKSYMSIGSSAGATHQRPAKVSGSDEYPFEVGITSIPQVDIDNPKVISQGPSVCILKSTNADPVAAANEELASWLLIRFLTTSVAFQADFSIASGYIPVLKQSVMVKDETFKENLDKANGTDYIASLSLKVALEQESAYYTSPAFVGSSEARTQVGKLMQACFAFKSAEHTDKAAYISELFTAAVAECKKNDN